MKKYFFYIFFSVLLSACTATNHLHEHVNPENQLTSLKLEQKLKIPQNGEKSSGFKSVLSKYIFGESKKEHKPIFVSFGRKQSEINSAIFILLDDENFRLDQQDNGNPTPESGTDQFEIPENLWVPIIYSKNIRYQILQNKKEIEINLDEDQSQKLKEFFRKIIHIQQLDFPTPPEGMKKW